jgi:hypothetical protein
MLLTMNMDASPAIEAARVFFEPAIRIEAPKEPLHYDAFTCDLFVLHVAKVGAETDIIVRFVKSDAQRTRPAS